MIYLAQDKSTYNKGIKFHIQLLTSTLIEIDNDNNELRNNNHYPTT